MTDNKFILDATAGFRMMWYNKQHPNCIYLDERPECEPDVIKSFTDLKCFPDNKFRLVVFDPPHIVKSKMVCDSISHIRYFGYLKAETWQSEIKKAFKELWRVLRPYGVLIFKWNTTSVSGSDILKICGKTPLFYQVSHVREKDRNGKRRKGQKTLWFCFMKIPQGSG